MGAPRLLSFELIAVLVQMTDEMCAKLNKGHIGVWLVVHE